MKRGIALLLLAVSAPGCMTLPSWWEKPKAEPPAEIVSKPVRPRPVVTADQITDNNGREMAGALLEELDRDAQPETLPATEKVPAESKTTTDKRHGAAN